MPDLTISVIVPTYKRPAKLKTCLEHLSKQSRKPNEIVITYREEDKEGLLVANSFLNALPIKLLKMTEQGVIAAENSALKTISNDIVLFIDDDGYAPADWVKKYEDFFIRNTEATGLGGPDIIKSNPNSYYNFPVKKVGIVTWYGKLIGNHHRQSTGIRKVDLLKGVNMGFKRSELPLIDISLSGQTLELGNGSQWETDICLGLRNRGKILYFDPELKVIHDSDHSDRNHFMTLKNNAFNIGLISKKHFSSTKLICNIIYSYLIGNTQIVGALKMITNTIKEKRVMPNIKKMVCTLKAYSRALMAIKKSSGKVA